jgi:hypothetical protein
MPRTAGLAERSPNDAGRRRNSESFSSDQDLCVSLFAGRVWGKGGNNDHEPGNKNRRTEIKVKSLHRIPLVSPIIPDDDDEDDETWI